MPPLHEQVRGRDHPPIGSTEDGRVVSVADEVAVAGRQQRSDRGDKTELTQVCDGDGKPPAIAGLRPRMTDRFSPGSIMKPTAGYLR
jgi:hypothetical protein